jgi:hypothetical protein
MAMWQYVKAYLINGMKAIWQPAGGINAAKAKAGNRGESYQRLSGCLWQ